MVGAIFRTLVTGGKALFGTAKTAGKAGITAFRSTGGGKFARGKFKAGFNATRDVARTTFNGLPAATQAAARQTAYAAGGVAVGTQL
jgi:hypothetical protein